MRIWVIAIKNSLSARFQQKKKEVEMHVINPILIFINPNQIIKWKPKIFSLEIVDLIFYNSSQADSEFYSKRT